MRVIRLAIAVASLGATTVFAATTFPVINPPQLAWAPKDALLSGAYRAVVQGDPHQGPYAFFGEFPARFRVRLH